MMDIKRVLLYWFVNFVVKSLLAGQLNTRMSDKELAEELHKTIIRKFQKEKVHSF